MSEEKQKRVGKVIAKSIDELAKIDEQQFIKASTEKEQQELKNDY